MPLDTLGTVLRSLQVPTWLLINFLVAEGSIGNRIWTTWTAIKVQSMYLQAISAFGYLGNGLTVFTGPHLVTGPARMRLRSTAAASTLEAGRWLCCCCCTAAVGVGPLVQV